MDPALTAATEIADDISDRRGIGDELDQIDPKTRAEMIESWASIIRRNCK